MEVPIPRLRTRFPDPVNDRESRCRRPGRPQSHEGVPYHQWLSVGDVIAWQLGEALPEREFRVTNLAIHGIKLDQVHLLLQRLKRRPDLAIIYSGHNEFAMRYTGTGHRTISMRSRPERIKDVGVIRRLLRCAGSSMPPWTSSCRCGRSGNAVDRRLVDVPVYTPRNMPHRLHDFRVRVEAITTYCESVGAQVVLVIPPGNDADFEPESVVPAGQDAPRRAKPSRGRSEVARQLEARRPRRGEGRPIGALIEAPAGIRRDPLPAGTARRRRPGIPTRPIVITSRPVTTMACRCVACPDFQDIYRRGRGPPSRCDPDRRPGGPPCPVARAGRLGTTSSTTRCTPR